MWGQAQADHLYRSADRYPLDQPIGSDYATAGHDHSAYFPAGHAHSAYFPAGHDHSAYFPAGHDHSAYFPAGHDHSAYFPAPPPMETANMPTYFDVTIIDSRIEDDHEAITVYGVRAPDPVAAKIAAILRGEYGEHDLKFLNVHVDSKGTVKAVSDDDED